MTTVLLTGFEPFDGAASNPSWDAVELAARDWTGPELVTARLPVSFAGAKAAMVALLLEHSPGIVVSVGLADNRTAVTPERVAINVEDARIPDNAGDQPVDRPILDDGPAAYFSRLPVKAIAERVASAGIPTKLSDSAGTYVCNSLMYLLLHAVADQPGVRAGFIHMPPTTVVPISQLAEAVAIAVRAALDDA